MVHFSHLTWCNEQYLVVVLSQIDLLSLKQYGNLQKHKKIMQFFYLIFNVLLTTIRVKQQQTKNLE